jgi:hypothetical protein
MRYYPPFEYSGDSFVERVGSPDPASAAIGQIALQFAALEAHLATTLNHLMEGDAGWEDVLTQALSFDAKLDLLEARVHLLAPTGAFNTGDVEPLELFAELRACCAQASRLRAQVLDPATADARLAHILNGWARPPSHELAGIEAMVYPNELLDIADFISMVIMELEEFFMLDWSPPPSSEIDVEGQG